MEIEEPKLEKQKSGSKRVIVPDEASIIVAQAAGELIGAQGSINVLNHIKNVVLGDDNQRRSNIPGFEPPINTPETEMEKFIKADYPSHLLKIAELENFIKISKQSTKIIDEADVSGASLWDFIEPEVQDEIKSQLEGLKSTASIKDSLKTELKSLASHTWESHKETKPGTESDRYKHYETMILGKDPKIKDQIDLQSVKADILDAEEVYEMLTFEKMRMVMSSYTSKPEEAPMKEKEGFEVMGEEFSLIKSQMDHMEKLLEIDWLKSVPDEGIQEAAKGQILICPEMAARMDGEPSDEQIKVLEEVYSHMANKRTEGGTNRDKLTEKTGFCLASMQLLEMGKKAKYMNVFQEIRKASKEKIEDILKTADKSTPGLEPDEAREAIESKADKEGGVRGMLKSGMSKVKGGVGKMIKGCPAVLAAQLWVMTKDKSSKEFSGHYGSLDDHHHFMKELGLGSIDQPS